VLWLYPSFIAPLFNRFTPLENPELDTRIHALAKRCNFGLSGLFVMDGSRRSAHGNAYFTGFGRQRRIVFFDTLLSRLNTDEVEAVLAHELGHFAHRHILRRIVIGFTAAGVLLHLLAWLSTQLWFYTGLGVIPQLGRPNDGLALVLFMLALPVLTFWTTPVASLLSRRDEFQADRYAVRQCGAAPLSSALVKLYDDNAATLTPDPIHSAWYDSHPPAPVRIAHLRDGCTRPAAGPPRPRPRTPLRRRNRRRRPAPVLHAGQESRPGRGRPGQRTARRPPGRRHPRHPAAPQSVLPLRCATQQAVRRQHRPAAAGAGIRARVLRR